MRYGEWTEDSQLWVQYVSSTPATRLDVITLQEKLDQQLQQRQVAQIALDSCCPSQAGSFLYHYVTKTIIFAGKRDWHLPCQRRAVCPVL